MARLNINFNSNFILGNKKTDFSVDIPTTIRGRKIPCPLMQWTKIKNLPKTKAKGDPNKEILTSPTCQGCYAMTNMNVRTNLRDKILALPEPDENQLELFKKDLPVLKSLGIKRLRFFSWTDFTPEAMPFILATANAGIEVHILSKLLGTRPNEKHLIKLFNHPNVIISLSFNKDWMNNFDRVKKLVENKRPNNVQLNYTINPVKEKIDINWLKSTFQVIHLKNNDKRRVGNEHGIPETQLCGVFDSEGNRAEKGGSCKSCNNCNLSFIAHQKGKTAKLPVALAA